MKDEKRTNPPEPSRRNFLKASAAGAVLTLGAGCAAMGCAVIARTIPGSRAEIFEEHEGGSHFTFLENPTKFNRLVTEFLE